MLKMKLENKAMQRKWAPRLETKDDNYGYGEFDANGAINSGVDHPVNSDDNGAINFAPNAEKSAGVGRGFETKSVSDMASLAHASHQFHASKSSGRR